MAEPKHIYDVWFVAANQVYRGVPFGVVTDWVQQARLGPDDMLKLGASAEWVKVASEPLFAPYIPRPEAGQVGDAAEALEPVEMDFNWKRSPEDDDDDVDMIPLIDISLVLLIFFMMTTTVAAISRIAVPTMENAIKVETNPKVLRLDIDMVDGRPLFGLGRGTAAPAGEDADLSDETALLLRLDAALATLPDKPEVRIAAHGELPYGTVERVMKELDRRRNNDLISEYSIEVNERPR
jgi:biopolymer transport protein ExbD